MAPLLAALAAKGLTLIGDAVMAKGKELVEEKLGVKLSPDLTPEQTLELKKLEYAHEQWLVDAAVKQAEQSLEETKVYLADVQNARGMQTEALKQDDTFSKRFLYYFAMAILGFTAVYISLITFVNIPQANLRFADTILGFLLGTCLATVINFFFGTSRSSQGKDSTIHAAVQKLTGGAQ